MSILTKEVEVKINAKTVKHYESLGYEIPKKKASDSHRKRHKKDFTYDFGKTIIVKTEDLTKGSNVEIEILCDACMKNKMIVPYFRYLDYVQKTGSYVCKNCLPEKRKQSIYNKYGVYNISELSEIREKACETTMKLYGKPYYTQTEECTEKRINTLQGRYGVSHNSQLSDYREKYDKTCKERYGELYHEAFARKASETFREKTGYDYPSQSPEVREKISQTLYKNNTVQTSRQQVYIFDLYRFANKNTYLNYPVSYYNVDICFPDEKLAIEYDGGFHDGQVKTGKISQEEFDQKEIVRNAVLKREGYKQMRIISSKDRLPQDSILLKMLSEAKQYFSETEHSWITYDIDNSRMINAENKDADGIPYDFGSLRTIKDSDLTKIENQNQKQNLTTKGA